MGRCIRPADRPARRCKPATGGQSPVFVGVVTAEVLSNGAIESTDGDYRILVLPWHQYVYFDWAERTVANPTPMFFGGEVISSHDPDLGIDTLATDPTRDEVRTLLAADDHDGFEEAVAALGVEYIVLLDVADIDQYDFLTERSELSVIVESAEVTVFHNEAFANAPPPDAWPADGSDLPVIPLLGGSMLSLGSSATILYNYHGAR